MTIPMPLDIPDYRADTAHLSAAEHGAYLLLIMHYWMTGGLPDDDAKLARITAMTQDEWTQARPTVEALFQPGWRHKRIDRELCEVEERAEIYERVDVELSAKRAAAGRAGAAGRWQNGKTDGKTDGKTEFAMDLPLVTTPLLEEDSSKKENKKEREGRKQRGTRLDASWTPTTSDLEAAKAEGLTEADIRRESAKFRDYWIAKPGQAGIKLDWEATWRNWCRKAAEFLGRAAPAQATNCDNSGLVYVRHESDEWGRYAQRWRDENHKDVGPPVDKAGGWWFPAKESKRTEAA